MGIEVVLGRLTREKFKIWGFIFFIYLSHLFGYLTYLQVRAHDLFYLVFSTTDLLTNCFSIF